LRVDRHRQVVGDPRGQSPLALEPALEERGHA
jgi:hypothetical protein